MAVAKTVLITGASSGIGEATAIRLAKGGWKVVATARQLEGLVAAAAAGCATERLDVADAAGLEAAVARIVDRHGVIGVLVNNAGYSQSGALEDLPMSRVRLQFETNVFGPLRLTQLLLPGMREQGWGKVVNISSMGGKVTFPGGGAYHGSKHALEALSDALRFEVAGFGVDVIVIQPGLIATRFFSTAVDSMGHGGSSGRYAALDKVVAEATQRSTTTGALASLSGTPDDVARTIERAINARRPRTRYKVAGSAHLLMGLRRMLGDRGWDRLLRTFYPQPRP